MSATFTNAFKIDVIVEAIAGITQMETEINLLETMQNSVDETDSPGQLHIDMMISVMDTAKDMCMNQIRSLSEDELRVLGTRTRI